MEHKKIQEFIDSFQLDKLEEEAIFGILSYGGGPDESFIKANKEGTLLYAIDLLKAVTKFEEMQQNKTNNKDNTIYTLETDNWIDENSETIIGYLDPIFYKRAKKKEIESSKNSTLDKIKNKATGIGCFAIIILIVVSTFVGLETIYHWFFK